MESIYNREKDYESELKRLDKSNISLKNKELILKYHNYILSEGASKNRIVKIFGQLRIIAGLLEKDFDNVDETAIRTLIVKINSRELSEITKIDFKKLVKRFYKWLEGDNEVYPKKVRWIKGREKLNNKEPIDIITLNEIRKVLKICDNLRDRAFISLLYEGGFRIGELLGMKIRDLKNEENYMRVRVTGKTGPREVLIIASISYLNQYLSMHPYKDNLDSYFWISIGYKYHNQRLRYAGANALIKRLFERAKVNKKRVYLHLFRHSRATELAKYLTEAQMKAYFGWTQGSNMASVYVHLSGRDVDNNILKYFGLESQNSKSEDRLEKGIACPRCNLINSQSEKSCAKCGLILNPEERTIKIDKNLEFLESISNNSDLMKKFDEFKEKINVQ